jgi:hypothetical protein
MLLLLGLRRGCPTVSSPAGIRWFVTGRTSLRRDYAGRIVY